MQPRAASSPASASAVSTLRPFGDGDHSALAGIGSEDDVVMAAGARGFVDGQFGDRGEIRLRYRQLNVAFADRHVAGLADLACGRSKGYLPAEHEHQRLEQ
jgi:hypothetical protein